MESGGKYITDKVCHICGHLGIPAAIATCSLCNVSTVHTYCMRFVPPEVPEVWQCDDCLSEAVTDKHVPVKQEEAFRSIGSNFGKQEKQKSLQKTNSRKIEVGKVKFISTTEVAELTSGIRSIQKGSYWGCRLMRSKSPPTARKNVSPTSPSSNELNVPFRLKKKPHAFAELYPAKDKMSNRHVNQKREVKPPLKLQDKCGFMEEQANAYLAVKKEKKMNETIFAYVSPVSNSEFKPPIKHQDECGFMEEPANASVAVKKEKNLDETIAANISLVNNSGIAIPSFLQCNKISDPEVSYPLKLVLSSDEKNQYALEACWRGAFEVVDNFSQVHGGVCAHLASQVSPKVYDISKQLPGTLKFKVLPRESVWPKIFKLQSPTKDDIALYFMCEVEGHKEKYNHFVQHINSHDYALKSCIADVKLLLFTSARLQMDSQKFGGSIYFWGVFHHLKQTKAIQERKADLCSTSNHKQVQSEEVDMEIDMLGGHHIGAIDVPTRLDVPPGFPKPMQRSRFLLKRPTKAAVLDVPPGFPVPVYKNKK